MPFAPLNVDQSLLALAMLRKTLLLLLAALLASMALATFEGEPAGTTCSEHAMCASKRCLFQSGMESGICDH